MWLAHSRLLQGLRAKELVQAELEGRYYIDIPIPYYTTLYCYLYSFYK